MNLISAVAVMNGALDEAQKRGLTVATAVVDASGDLVCFSRLDGTQPGSIEVALMKARCTVRFRRATSIWEERIKQTPGLSGLPGVLAVAGGVPIVQAEQMVGGVGVSGASPEDDELCAIAGINSLRP
jgi:glc operon protein GlcG